MTREMSAEQSQGVAADQGEARHSAKTVSDQFVHQFYKVLERYPKYLRRFYGEASTLTVSETGEGGAEVVETAQDQEAIHELLMAFFSEASAVCESVCPQASTGNGILLLVMGRLSRKGKPDCLFSQTLFLAAQSKGFFVLNDIIRLTPIGGVAKSTPQLVHTHEVPIPAGRKAERDRADSDRGSSPGTPARCDFPPYTAPRPNPARYQERDPARLEPHATPHVSRPAPPEAEPPIDGRRPEAEPAKAPRKKAFCDDAGDVTRQRTCSIFVRGIPDGADARTLAAVFSKFGRLAEGGVTIKQGRRDRFAFVEFEGVGELEGALGGEVRVCGQPVVVEEKRPMVIRRPARVKRSLSGHSGHSREANQVSSPPGYVGSPCAARPFHHPQMGPHPMPYVIQM